LHTSEALVIAHVKATVGDLEACFVVTGKVISLKALEAGVRGRRVVETVWDGYVTYTINQNIPLNTLNALS
jgi:hypothetical protein